MKVFSLAVGISLISSMALADVTLWGRRVAVGEGTVRTYAKVDCNEKPLALGIALSGSALQGLPSEKHEYDYLLPMPEGLHLPPYEHVMINWNPHGHDPVEIYGASHFDFHFYTISNRDRKKITCMDQDETKCMKVPSSEYLPPFYAPTPAGVPQMGWHWFDTRSPEFNGHPFTSTLIYGFYNAKIAFIEPMITRDFLLQHPSFSAEIPLPQKVNKTGYYPRRYTMKYDSARDLVMIELKHFKKMRRH